MCFNSGHPNSMGILRQKTLKHTPPAPGGWNSSVEMAGSISSPLRAKGGDALGWGAPQPERSRHHQCGWLPCHGCPAGTCKRTKEIGWGLGSYGPRAGIGADSYILLLQFARESLKCAKSLLASAASISTTRWSHGPMAFECPSCPPLCQCPRPHDRTWGKPRHRSPETRLHPHTSPHGPWTKVRIWGQTGLTLTPIKPTHGRLSL